MVRNRGGTSHITGFKTVAQAEENAGTLRYDLFSPEQLGQIEQAIERAQAVNA